MIQRVVVAGVLIKKGKALIIQRSKNERSYPNVWEIPSGKLEFGENPNNGVVREFKEETGIATKLIKPLSIGHFKIRNRHCVQINYLVSSKSTKVKLSSEHQNYAWITPREFDKYKLFKDLREAIRLALKASE